MRDPNHREIIYKGRPIYSAFWPVFLMLLSVVMMMCYQLYWVLEQHQSLNKQIIAQANAVSDSEKAQRDLEKLISDLISISGKDADARAIIQKNKITHTPEQRVRQVEMGPLPKPEIGL